MNLYIVRHGEAGQDRKAFHDYRPKNKYDLPLTAKGISQAQALGKRLQKISFDKVFVSDYHRALETYEHLKFENTEPIFSTEIREIFCELIGLDMGNSDLNEMELQKQRIESFHSQVLQKADSKSIYLIVAHGCFNLYLIKLLTGVDCGTEMDNTALTVLSQSSKGSWNILSFNDTSHLEEHKS